MKLTERTRNVVAMLLYAIVTFLALAVPRELSERLSGLVWCYQAAVLFGVAVVAAGISFAERLRGGNRESGWTIFPSLLLASTWYVVIRHRSVWPLWAWLAFPVVTFIMTVAVSPFGRRRSASS